MLKLDVLAAELNLWANETEQIYRATKESKYRGDAKHLRYLAATLNQSSLPSTGVTSFNTRVGDVVLSSLDVTTALGYNPVTQARTLTINGVTYDLSANRSWTISTAIPTLAQVTTAGNTTTNAIGIGTTGPIDFNLVVEGVMQVRNSASSFIGLRIDSTSIKRRETGTFSLGTNDVTSFHIFAPTNNIGINTTTDAGYKLDVDGTLRATGIVYADSTINQPANFGNKLLFMGSGNYSKIALADGTNWSLDYHSGTTVGNVGYHRFYTGSTSGWVERMRIDNNGNVGIGTTTPTYKLEVSSAGYTGFGIMSGENSSAEINFQNTGYGLPRWTIRATGAPNGSSGGLTFQRLASTFPFSITSGENVLIGTGTDAGYKLDVNGTARVQTSLEIVSTAGVTFGGGATALSWAGSQLHLGNSATWADVRFYTGAILKYSQTSSVTTIVNTTINLATTTVQLAGVNALTYSGTDIRIGSVSAGFNSLSLYVAGSEKARIDSSGNFGLGTTNPTDKFHIVDNTNGNKFGRISAGGTDASAAWVAQNDQVDNVVYRVFGSAVIGTQMGISLARSASLMANLGGSGKFLVGTYSSTDFVMGTGNQERMRLVDSTGNFLIGTMTDSGHRLNVSGTANVSGNLTVGGIVDTAATYTNCALLSSINVGTNSTAIISFTAKQDPNGWWNAGTKKWTPTIAGYYYVALQVRWDIGTLGNQINIQILKNTSTQAIAQDLLPTNTGLTQTTNCIVYMNGSTDYLEFSGFTSSTTGEFLFGEPSGTWTFFNAFRIN